MQENTLPRISQTKWARQLLIILMTAILMISASAPLMAAWTPPPSGGLTVVADAAVRDTITIDGVEWIKIQEQIYTLALPYQPLFALLIKKDTVGEPIFYSALTSSPTLYKNSNLRSIINNWYVGANIPTIKAYAMKNRLSYPGYTKYLDEAGNPNLDKVTSVYYEPAYNVTTDIAFAPAYLEEAKLIGANVFGPSGAAGSFLRTHWTGSAWGAWIHTTGQGFTQINSKIKSGVRPSVWVYQGPKTPEPQILSLSTAPITTLIANHPANLPIALTGTNLTGKTATFSLVNSAGVAVYTSPVTSVSDNFYQILNISASALTIPYGQYTVRATLVGAAGTASVPLTIAEDLDKYWTFGI
ncbi:MAG: hypothetical protein LBT32_02595, partial [Peptococcaceae bacterium]|nr:hypothetical protein [Peptococcaceae bacterium]